MKSFYLTKEVLENFEKNGFIYYQVQKEIFEMFFKKELTETAFKIYVLLFDRAKLSFKNGWYDETGITVKYSYAELKSKLNVSNTPIANGLELLEHQALIRRVKNYDSTTTFYIGYLVKE